MRLLETAKDIIRIEQWHRQGRSIPPHQGLKRRVVHAYAALYRIQNFVETGTYKGDMVHAMKNRFKKITSIEVDEALAAAARTRFNGEDHITIVHGDSGVVLPDILAAMKGTCLFWLDGHYSGGETSQGARQTPVVEELRHIGAHGDRPVILIDDARLFDGTDDYPTIDQIQVLVREFWPDYQCEVNNDIIRIHPRLHERRRFWRNI